MKQQQLLHTIQQPRSPQGIQTPSILSPQGKALLRIDNEDGINNNQNQKQRSYSIKVEGCNVFNSKTKENKPKKIKTNKGKQHYKEKKLSEMSPREITNLMKENQVLKDEIMRMQTLMMEVVPVFNKITEEFDEDQAIFKTQDDLKKTRNFTTSNKKTPVSQSKNQKKFEEITFLQQSLKHLKCYYDQKETQTFGQKLQEDSEFLDAENLDMTTLDERQTCGNRIKSSVLTFGNAGTFIEQAPGLNNNQLNTYNMSTKSKISDLNKQGKNYNMPVSVEGSFHKKQQIIDYDEIERLKNLINHINNPDVLKELRNDTSCNQKNTQETKSRNQDYNSQPSQSDFGTNDSGFSDDPSIPADSFHKDVAHYNIMPHMQSKEKSPFNKFMVQNMKQKYNDSEKKLNKLPQKHEMTPIQVLSQATKAFNSCQSIDSNESDTFTMSVNYNPHHPIQTIQSNLSNRIKDSFTPEKKGISPMRTVLESNKQTPVLSPINSNFVLSPSRNERNDKYMTNNPVANKVGSLDEFKRVLTTDNERYAHYIREVNYDQLGDRDHLSNDNIGVEFFFQSQSKDCFSQSIESTEQNHISKRESVDQMLWMLMKSDTPLKSPETNQKSKIVYDDTMKIIQNPEDEFTLNQRLSSGFKKLRQANKENSSSPLKTPQGATKNYFSERQLSPGSEIVVSKVLEESIPSQQFLYIQQEQKPHLEISQTTSSFAKRSLSKSNSIGGQCSIAPGQDIFKISRVKSLSQYNMSDQVRHIIINDANYQHDGASQNLETEQNEKVNIMRRSPSFNQKWTTLEEKEKNLASLNQEIITRTHDSTKNQQDNYKEDMQPSNNLKITEKLCPKSQDESLCMFDNSSLMIAQESKPSDKEKARESCLFTMSVIQQQIVNIESPCILKASSVQRIIPKSMNQSPSKLKNEVFDLQIIQVDNSPLITLMNTSKSESESGVSNKSQNRYSKFIYTTKNKQIQQELQILDLELHKQEVAEKVYLETPSPRVLETKNQTPQFTLDHHLRVQPDNNVTFKLNDSETMMAPSEHLKKEREELTSRRVSTADRRENESVSRQSMDQCDFLNEQMKINRQSHERINSCCLFQVGQQLFEKSTEQVHRGSEIEEAPRQAEFTMAKKPQPPQLMREVIDYAPRQTPIPEEGSSTHSSIVDIKISPNKKSIRDNTVIEEQPSDEEADNSKPVVVESTLINLLSSEENSKISIGQVEMMEGEMFSTKGMIMSARDSLLQNKDTCQSVKGSDLPSNYNSSRYKTPLKQFINSGLKSQQSNVASQKALSNHSQVKGQVTTESGLENEIVSLKASMIKSPHTATSQTEEKKTPLRKPFSVQKRDGKDTREGSCRKNGVSKTRVDEQAMSENNTSRSQKKSARDKLNKMRIDFTGDRQSLTRKFSQKNEISQSILVPLSDNTFNAAKSNSRIRSNYSSVIQKSANTTPKRTSEKRTLVIHPTLSPISNDIRSEIPQSRHIPTTCQSLPDRLRSASKPTDIEIKLKEKEQRIKEIMQRKIQLDEQRVQIRKLKEEASLVARKNDKISLSKGIYLRKQSQETVTNQSINNTLASHAPNSYTNASSNVTNANQTQPNQHHSISSISQQTMGNTPTSCNSKQKIILKKEQILQSFCNNNQQSRKVIIKPELKSEIRNEMIPERKSNGSVSNGGSNIFCTIEAMSTTPSCTSYMPHYSKETPVQSSLNQIEAFIGPQTERVYPVNFRDTSSPISGLQPTIRQVEFFKKIEDDCLKRKMKHQSRLEHVSQSKLRQNQA